VEIYGRARQDTGEYRIRRRKDARIQTHSEYVIIVAFSRQQWSLESASMLGCTYIACLVDI
jgi:hypothetical protein